MFYEYQRFTMYFVVAVLGAVLYLAVVRQSLPGVIALFALLFAGVSQIDPRWADLWQMPAIGLGLCLVFAALFLIDQVIFEQALNKWRHAKEQAIDQAIRGN